MRHIVWEDQPGYSTAVLVKASSFNKQEIENNYITPLAQSGVPAKDVIAFTLDYNEVGKAPAAHMKQYLSKLLPALKTLGTSKLFVTDVGYFKTLTGQAKAEPHLGYVLPCKIKGYEHMDVILSLNYHALIYNPKHQAKLDLSIKTLADSVNGGYIPPGQGIIHSAQYPQGLQEVAAALESLHQYPRLTADIEAFSLDFDKAGIGTIAFAWDKHNGVAFECDYMRECSEDGFYGYQSVNPHIRKLLRTFLETYQGELTWHKADYDVMVIIYTLWMKDALDTEGLLKGLEIMTRSIQDTKIIAYLATNTTAGNVLGLKALAHEFAGNWAVEVKDIRKVPLDKLLEYNVVDALSTWYVRDKYYPIMVADQQEELYKELMLPSLKLIIQIQLTGMPLNPAKVKEVKAKLEAIRDGHLDVITNSPVIHMLNLVFRQTEMEKANAKLKVKQHPLSHFDGVVFNPNSGPQLQRLLYDQMGLPVIDLTDTKQPATGADTLEKLINHTNEPTYKAILEALIGYGKATKILSAFIPAFEAAIDKGDFVVWLHGCFTLGGTVSGRLSSSDPNLQNIPAKSIYAKLIKECFVGPPGWLFCGADFNSLEDMISALTTKDPNKLKVYTDGFDGHALRAVSYFPEELAHIDGNDPKSVNTLKTTDHPLRQYSKAPTFALTYQGTYHTLMTNLGWSLEKAKAVEANYHELYKVSDDYVQTRLEQATKDGYVTVAFGLRVRTPLLSQVVWDSRIPNEASAEGRTAGNAMGQSYGLLNNRAAVDFMRKVWASPYRLLIKPVALIHDAIYILVLDRSDVMEFANRELIKSMQWQELPEIQHPTVKLGAALDIFWPSWANATTLPNDADRETIYNICQATKGEILEMV
jgi:DNA polymerase-1